MPEAIKTIIENPDNDPQWISAFNQACKGLFANYYTPIQRTKEFILPEEIKQNAFNWIAVNDSYTTWIVSPPINNARILIDAINPTHNTTVNACIAPVTPQGIPNFDEIAPLSMNHKNCSLFEIFLLITATKLNIGHRKIIGIENLSNYIAKYKLNNQIDYSKYTISSTAFRSVDWKEWIINTIDLRNIYDINEYGTRQYERRGPSSDWFSGSYCTACQKYIRPPSRRFPFSHANHLRTDIHRRNVESIYLSQYFDEIELTIS